MDDIDAMFSDMLQEMDLLTQSLGEESETLPKPPSIPVTQEMNFSIGFADFNESLNDLEDNDLDALMADLVADISATEEKFATEKESSKGPTDFAPPPVQPQSNIFLPASTDAPRPATSSTSISAPPPPPTAKPSKEELEEQIKADKIKLALEKLKEAKVKKLVVKVEITDGSSKTLMVDERQTVRDVIDNLFEKTHCDCKVDWSVCETNPDLQTERGFEDHENLVEPLSTWQRDSENKLLFQEKNDKYEVFKNPQVFYLWKKDKKSLKDMKEKDKEQLLEENFCGPSVIVPDLEGVLHLKEDGKKSWKQRYFLLRASGLYYSPKGKTKASRDLVCLVQFDNVNVYYCKEYKIKYKAPTDHCFILKHPQIQKESQYIKYLCCDDEWSMTLWVTGIRVAKYGKQLYDNYKAAVRKAAGSATWTNRTIQGSPSISNASTPSPTPKAKAANGHVSQPPMETKGSGNQTLFPPPPASMENLPPPPPDPVFLPPPPPTLPTTTKGNKFPPPPQFPQSSFPPPPMDDLPPPPPPPEDVELPPNFLPPPPPSFVSCGGGSLPPPPPDPLSYLAPPPPPLQNFASVGGGPPPPPPPPPPAPASPAANHPPGSIRKVAPPPPRRSTAQLSTPSGGDLMSELMSAMQKKRSQP
ncbi:amyloid beta A4 precursor protein-binding family B member 1-interacting protein-like [Myxocyprinus asiaticus]|uniref:amyloid beta A4 precursor protein-binding family B member 1-interacting protein-like n=1 Tax=Myxocyprinus asiaticus TaxID=70543 RepID=UPI002222476E|nr:amyloid beta A4 precursor protein-binding family B member 1-interacting protein-like [Myxocyprinus asiaticus]XP_051538420.1 amyloid beta A4 precursor protein-binding family B member 1-interacting protein-like [Myxocyprinus asiaticus]